MVEIKDLVMKVLSNRQVRAKDGYFPDDIDRQYFTTFASVFVRNLKRNDPKWEGEVWQLVSELLKEADDE